MMNDVEAILQESRAILDRATGLEQAVGTLLPDYANLKDMARALADTARTFSAGLEIAATPMLQAAPPTEAAAEEPDVQEQEVQAPEAEQPQAPAETEEPPAVALARDLAGIKSVIEQDNLVVDVQDYRFAEKAGELVENLGEDARGQKAARALFDCVRFMDVLDRDYSLPGYERLIETVGNLRRELARFMKESFGIEFIPDPCVQDSAGPSSLAGLQDARKHPFPSSKPAGEALALVKRGAKLHGGVEAPEILVSTGSATPAFTLVRNLARALLAPAKLPPRLRQGRAAAAKEMRQKYLPQLANADEDRAATVLRYVANSLQAINKEDSLKDLMRAVLAALADLGFKAVPVRLGGTFDDSYSTSKYERKSVPSLQPKGTIVEVFQIGFVNRDGVPVQKATVGVSNGMPG
jgi:hypothetical protein